MKQRLPDPSRDLSFSAILRVNRGNKSWVLFYRERLPDMSGGFAPGKRLCRLTLGIGLALFAHFAKLQPEWSMPVTAEGVAE